MCAVFSKYRHFLFCLILFVVMLGRFYYGLIISYSVYHIGKVHTYMSSVEKRWNLSEIKKKFRLCYKIIVYDVRGI